MSKELKPNVAALAETLTGLMSYNKADKTVDADKDIYTKTLPEGISAEIVQQVSEHNTAFVAAGAKAFGDLAIAAMAKDKSIDRIATTVALTGKDSANWSLDRKVVSPNPAKPGEEVVKFGVLRSSLDFAAGRNSGQYKVVRSNLMELAEEALGK